MNENGGGWGEGEIQIFWNKLKLVTYQVDV